MAATKYVIKFTSNFERNLDELESFLLNASIPNAFDALLDELTDTVLPNLQHFPGMGRSFLEKPLYSAEVAWKLSHLVEQLHEIDVGGELREYVMKHYLLLYVRANETVYLLSIRHHRQLSFDFQERWPTV